jgi:ankyrin repeat protein
MVFPRLLLAVTVMLGLVTINANGQDGTAMPVIEQSVLQEFLVAARANNTDKLNVGLKAGIPVDSSDASGRTALMIATHANAIDAARVLIEAGADVNAKDRLNDSPYLYAGAEGRLEILKMTVAAGADLEAVNRYGGTALIPAAHHGHVEVVRYLLTTETDIDHVNFLGWTALLEAVILGDGGPSYHEIVDLLLQAGAEISIGDNEGVTALEHARSRGQTEITRLLEKHAEKRD